MSNSSAASTVRPHSNMQFMGAGTNHISPMTDGSGSGGGTVQKDPKDQTDIERMAEKILSSFRPNKTCLVVMMR
jgi:hypothetical protein